MTVGEPYLLQPAPGVHAYVQPDGGWCLNNAGFVSDGGRTLLIDTAATERRARALRDAVVAAGVPLPRTVVNTPCPGAGGRAAGRFGGPEGHDGDERRNGDPLSRVTSPGGRCSFRCCSGRHTDWSA